MLVGQLMDALTAFHQAVPGRSRRDRPGADASEGRRSARGHRPRVWQRAAEALARCGRVLAAAAGHGARRPARCSTSRPTFFRPAPSRWRCCSAGRSAPAIRIASVPRRVQRRSRSPRRSSSFPRTSPPGSRARCSGPVTNRSRRPRTRATHSPALLADIDRVAARQAVLAFYSGEPCRRARPGQGGRRSTCSRCGNHTKAETIAPKPRRQRPSCRSLGTDANRCYRSRRFVGRKRIPRSGPTGTDDAAGRTTPPSRRRPAPM